jgi:prephenate dehydratase
MLDELVCARQTYEAAIQGHGAFGEEAALRLLPQNSDVMTCAGLEGVFNAVNDGTARYGVVPIENNLTGSFHQTYDLMFDHNLTIVAETICRIEYALVGVPGAQMRNIRRAFAHPLVLAQCEQFFHRHPAIEPVSIYDPAAQMKNILNGADPTLATIATECGVIKTNGAVVAHSIQDRPENSTRFLLISKPMEMVRPQTVHYKRTIVFRIVNEPGALCRALRPFADHSIDVAKIESRPVKGSPWEYMFYLDLIGRADYEQMHSAVEELRRQALSLRVLGMYPRAELS